MLPAGQRLRQRREFRRVQSGGRRAGRRTVAGYLLVDSTAPESPAQVGFIVSRAVGSAVVRNRVRRQLSELLRRRPLPAGSRLVLRVLPPAAGLTSPALDAELDALVRRLGASRT